MSPPEHQFDAATFRKVLGHYPTGVCVITAIEPQGGPVGLSIGSFTSVSLDPPLVAFFPARTSSSWPRIERAGRFCVNVLAADQEDVCRIFASGRPDKFDGISHRLSDNGSPVLDNVVAWIDCTLDAVHEAGDHFIVVGRVRSLDVVRPDRPLLFYRGSYGDFSPFAPQALAG